MYGTLAMDVTKPYKFIGFGAMDVTKPYKFIGFGAPSVGLLPPGPPALVWRAAAWDTHRLRLEACPAPGRASGSPELRPNSGMF